jgi:hypothetical protein
MGTPSNLTASLEGTYAAIVGADVGGELVQVAWLCPAQQHGRSAWARMQTRARAVRVARERCRRKGDGGRRQQLALAHQRLYGAVRQRAVPVTAPHPHGGTPWSATFRQHVCIELLASLMRLPVIIVDKANLEARDRAARARLTCRKRRRREAEIGCIERRLGCQGYGARQAPWHPGPTIGAVGGDDRLCTCTGTVMYGYARMLASSGGDARLAKADHSSCGRLQQ